MVTDPRKDGIDKEVLREITSPDAGTDVATHNMGTVMFTAPNGDPTAYSLSVAEKVNDEWKDCVFVALLALGSSPVEDPVRDPSRSFEVKRVPTRDNFEDGYKFTVPYVPSPLVDGAFKLRLWAVPAGDTYIHEVALK